MFHNSQHSSKRKEGCETHRCCCVGPAFASTPSPVIKVPKVPSAKDPDHQQLIFKDIEEAYKRIRPHIDKTPCIRSKLCADLDMQLFIKDETKHYTGSFKERGARNALLKLTEEQKKAGVVTFSAGNHALSLSHHGRLLGVPVTIVMPCDAPTIKLEKCKTMGGEVLLRSGDLQKVMCAAVEEAEQSKRVFISPYDHMDVMAGQGTIGMEILQDVPDVDAVLVPIGGGGLVAGVATAIKHLSPSTEIIGVESVKCPSFHNALLAGKPVLVPCSKTLTDGMVVPCVGHNAFYNARRKISRLVLVDEEMVERAMLCLAERDKMVAEGSGAAAMAVLTSGQLPDLMGKRVVVVVTGGNVDALTFSRVLQRALMHEGLVVRFEVALEDSGAAVSRLMALIADTGATVREMRHERCGHADVDVFSMLVSVVCETCTWKQSEDLMDRLEKTYPEIRFERDANPNAC